MILVGTICAVLWGIGWAMGAPNRQRWVMIAVVFAAVIFAHVILPDGHPLRQNTGGHGSSGPSLRLLRRLFGSIGRACANYGLVP
jgi:hypothetical protein